MNINIILLIYLFIFYSESELEEILTVYTRHNKSASIFLGAKAEKKSTENENVSEHAEKKKKRNTYVQQRFAEFNI